MVFCEGGLKAEGWVSVRDGVRRTFEGHGRR